MKTASPRCSIAILSILILAESDSLHAADASPADRPHVIFILADDLGWHDVGCFGSTHGRSNSAAVRFPCTARGTPAAT